jgi:hypothetical protein
MNPLEMRRRRRRKAKSMLSIEYFKVESSLCEMELYVQ